MIKGWRNDPKWVLFYEQKKEQRRNDSFLKSHIEMEMEISRIEKGVIGRDLKRAFSKKYMEIGG